MYRKYQNGGQDEISERQYFANYLKEAEATDAYMMKTQSLVKKEDGTYYKALEDGIYYPYNDLKGNQTIGYGRHTNTILKDYPKGISVAKANEFLLEDIDKKFDRARDQYDFGHVGSGIDFEGFGEGEFDKLSEREQYMVTNFFLILVIYIQNLVVLYVIKILKELEMNIRYIHIQIKGKKMK